MNSSDKVKKIVLTEGRTARNLVLYNVPLQPDTSSTGGLQTGNLSYIHFDSTILVLILTISKLI